MSDFLSSVLPPMRTGDWLAKPASRIAATFHEAGQATDWMADEYAKVREALLLPEGVPLKDRLEIALDLLPRGVDVQWGEWLQGGRFATIGVICCPNRHVPTLARPAQGEHGVEWHPVARNWTSRSALEVGMTMEEFHGPHVKPLKEAYVAIDWSAPMARCNSVRVRSYTCDCLPTVYELCVAGGLGHIRRTERSAKGDRVSESPWLRDAEAKRLWHGILEGDAR